MKTQSSALKAARRLSAVVLTAFCICQAGYAQRTMRDQNLLTASMQTPCTGIKDFGASVSYGRYLLDAYWKASASVVPRGVQLSTGDRMDLFGLRAGADYMYRIASVRSRVFSMYAGGGAFIGYELYDPLSRLPENIHTGLGDGAFIYGLNAGVEAEVFLGRRTAFVAGCTVPMTFGSVSRWLRINATAGIRFNI